MVRDQTDGNIFLLIGVIDHVCRFTDLVADRADRIDVKDGIYTLGYHGQSL